MTDWQRIETAPRDGTRFLATNGTEIIIGFYIQGRHFAADSWRGSRNTTPTHWMPLPAAPGSPSDYNELRTALKNLLKWPTSPAMQEAARDVLARLTAPATEEGR